MFGPTVYFKITRVVVAVLLSGVLAACSAATPTEDAVSDVPTTAVTATATLDTPQADASPTDATGGSRVCLDDFQRQELAQADQSQGGQPRYTLSQEELSAYLDLMGIESVCLPAEWGAPFVNVDWNSADASAQSGRMVSLGFEGLYDGAGWSDAALVYSTYDFAAGTEYDVFATEADRESVRDGSIPGMISVDGFDGFSRLFAGIPMGQQWVWKTFVFPFDTYYLAIVLRLGAFDAESIEDTLLEIEEGNYPVEAQADVDLLEGLVSSIQFSSAERTSFALHLVSSYSDPRGIDQTALDQVEVDEPALIRDSDIVSYDLETHEIELTDEAFVRFVNVFELPVDVDGIPFVVFASGEPIYSGALYTPASSVSYDGVVILQPFSNELNTILLLLGYPGVDVFQGQDPRSDQRVIDALTALGKTG